MSLRVVPASFNERLERSRFIAAHMRLYLGGKVLDVGCDEGHLRGLMPGIDYTGIDVGGTPDVVVDLEAVERLPFEDQAFDTVLCSDVLEHLDSLHRVFGELVRVTRRWLVISLPNNWTNARRPIERGAGSFAFYGLPADKPRDRHKWFFGLSEARDFFYAQESRFPIRVVECFANEKRRPPWVVGVRRLLYPTQLRYLNRYAHTLWAVFQRTGT
jgi:2-polyprenyl-3-methyl-5-hydroxy-6-metoxy-1,4-benzoquinol methylase